MDAHKAEKAQKIKADMRLLELLSQTFPTIEAACTEIINLEAILNLPKGTEHFVADLTYDVGLSNICHDEFDTSHNRSLSLSLGVNF